MKLNWFSPLPPARSAIAEYAAGVLPELARHAEVTAWTDGEGAPSAISPVAGSGHGGEGNRSTAGAPVRHYRAQAPPWDEINRADVSIYHIGNHAGFHAGIWDLSRRHPGIVVLHDARLQEFVAADAHRRNDLAAYRALMKRHHGARGAAAAQDVCDGVVPPSDLVEAFPLTAAFVEEALGVVVHGAEALDMVERCTAGPILCAALPYRATRAGGRARVWRPPFRLIVFGYLGGDRGLDTVLAALARLPERDAFHLDVFGELPHADEWAGRVRAANLAGHVTLHGFVPAEALDTALEHAHLALNLRLPSRGEASFSLLHAWDHALPVVVNRIGAFTEIPATCVAFARAESAADDVANHLRALHADPEPYRSMGAAARDRMLRLHDPERYAEQLARFAAHAAAQRSRPTARRMAARAAAALRAVAEVESDDALRRVATAIHGLTREPRPR